MPQEPDSKRTCVFVDGQNLFHSAKEAFGYTYPNFDVLKLAGCICQESNLVVVGIYFYTGIPDATDDPFWNHFWVGKMAMMGRQGIKVYSRPLRYSNESITLPNGTTHTILVGREKGIDVRLSIDCVRMAIDNVYDVAVIFSQDQDLSEVADEIKQIAKRDNRWIKLISAFPFSPTSRNRRGIEGTQWKKIDRQTYDTCIDGNDYRKPRK